MGYYIDFPPTANLTTVRDGTYSTWTLFLLEHTAVGAQTLTGNGVPKLQIP